MAEKRYTVELTEAEIEGLVHGQELVKINLTRGGGSVAKSSSVPGVREAYDLIDKLYTALLREYAADLADRAAAAAASVLGQVGRDAAADAAARMREEDRIASVNRAKDANYYFDDFEYDGA